MKIIKKLAIHASIGLALLSPNIHANDELTDNIIETVSVTGTREDKNTDALAESVEVLNQAIIENVNASHPSELINRSAGVHINNLGGEGHMTAIRQPITTRGVYLFLEDSVPIRPAGFFNHNALYEVNIPQSRQVEVVKGPGTALYGSEAIGGMINTLSQQPPKGLTTKINIEGGSFGWQRYLLSAGDSSEHHGIIVSGNFTQSDGYREASEYDRQSGNIRFDNHFDNLSLKTLVTYTAVNQQGVSTLTEDDYKNNPKKNVYHGDTGFREVSAFQLSTEVTLDLSDKHQIRLIPFYRNNKTSMAPSWMITYDPNQRETEFQSYGLLTNYGWDISPTTQWLMGVDIDVTPSRFEESAIVHTQEGEIYTGFTKDALNYDFDAEQHAISPYVRLEGQWIDNVILSVGLRYDYFAMDYTDNLDTEETTFNKQLNKPVTHYRPENQSLTFTQFSPKFGLVYQYADFHNLYMNYRHAFSTPSISKLFRSGSTVNSDKLKPIKADSIEFGLKGLMSPWLAYELALYHMEMTDDLVDVIIDDNRNTVNAGETEHQGVELTLKGDITHELAYALAYSHTKQKYNRFSYRGGAGNVDVSNNNVAKAPESTGNLSLLYAPAAIDGLKLTAEWSHLGPYYVEETNLNTYEGHDIFNLRAAYQVNDMLGLYLKGHNMTDKRYSTYTSARPGTDKITYRVGNPRSFAAGLRLAF
ncbi:MAG: TonB-dependent receptor [Cellvibrionales bacterium]|nr:TonB-dependent receptor [Cellvibrionales bacterium]